jgi:chromate transport protein ChrA
LWRYPVAAFIYWTDILLAPLTAFLVLIHWPYAVMTGYRLEVTLTEMVLYATGGILLSMAFRQVAHLWKHPRDIALLPLFVLVATCLQVVRTYALITIFKVNVWGTRSGADRRDEDAKTVHTELTHAELTGLS